MAQVVAWLQSQGFTITQTARSRLWISFTGTAAQVQSAFHTEIHRYSVDGKTYYANASEPAVPAALADVVLGVTALDNYGPRPRSVFRIVAPGFSPALDFLIGQRRTGKSACATGGTATPGCAQQENATPDARNVQTPAPGFSPAGAALKGGSTPALAALKGGATPDPGGIGTRTDFTSYLSGNNFLAPADFAVIYGVNALYSMGIDGTGQKIAVVGQTDLHNGRAATIATFRSVSGLPVNPPQIMLVRVHLIRDSVPGDYNEASLDVEWSGAVAKNATIIYVNSTNAIHGSLKTAITSNLAPVITVSYGLCEPEWTANDRSAFEGYFAQANSQGQTIVVASGDSGAADCDYSTSTSTVTSATHGLAVDYPASSAYVTAMGGSEFNEGVGNYWSPAPGTTDVSPSALSYIPEMAWNDTASTLNTTGILLAGGGGASAYYPKPSWQTGTGVPSDGARDVPDLSMNASPEHDGYLVCVQGSCVNGYRLSATNSTIPMVSPWLAGPPQAPPPLGGLSPSLIRRWVPHKAILTRNSILWQPPRRRPFTISPPAITRFHARWARRVARAGGIGYQRPRLRPGERPGVGRCL